MGVCAKWRPLAQTSPTVINCDLPIYPNFLSVLDFLEAADFISGSNYNRNREVPKALA